MRVSSGQVTAEFLQAELGAPSLATAGRMNGLPPEAMKRLEIAEPWRRMLLVGMR